MADLTETQQALANIITAIKNYSKNPVTELTINGRTTRFETMAQLIAAKKQLEIEVQREEDAANIAAGLGRKKILTRMGPTW
jgi:glycerol kinase